MLDIDNCHQKEVDIAFIKGRIYLVTIRHSDRWINANKLFLVPLHSPIRILIK